MFLLWSLLLLFLLLLLSKVKVKLTPSLRPKTLTIRKLAIEISNGRDPIDILKRCRDDIFLVYTDTVQSLHTFLSELNNIHSSIKFTMSHTTPSTMENPDCGCKTEEAVQFLDTSCKISDGRIITDLFRKETDRNQYLLPSSCHRKIYYCRPVRLGLGETFNNKPCRNVIPTRLKGALSVKALVCVPTRSVGTLLTTRFLR